MHESNPLVSVLIPAYNHESYIHDTLEDIKNQTYANMEIVILNDGSTDNTSEIIRLFANQYSDRFRRFVFIDKDNEGLCVTLNQGLKLINGDYVFHIASDDRIIDATAIERLVAELAESPDIGMACADAIIIDSNGKPIVMTYQGETCDTVVKRYFPSAFGLSLNHDFGSYKALLITNHIPIGLLVRASVYDDIGCYTPGIFLEDWDFWIRLSKKYRASFIPSCMMAYRIHRENTVFKYEIQLLENIINMLMSERAFAIEKGHLREWRYGAFMNALVLMKRTIGSLLFFKALRVMLLSISWSTIVKSVGFLLRSRNFTQQIDLYRIP